MARRIIDDLCRQIRARSRMSEGPTLPSLRVLARELSASPRSVARALQALDKEGTVEYRWGRLTRIAGRVSPTHVSRSTSVARLTPVARPSHPLLGHIRGQLATGVIVPGTALPKYGWFVRTHHVSQSVVRDALVRLSQEGLIHKSGKRWIAGPQTARRARGSRNVIVMLMHDFDYWKNHWLNPDYYAFPFGQTFIRETERRGIRTLLAYADDSAPEQTLVRGPAQLASLLDGLGADCLGTLWFVTPYERNRMQEFLPMLTGRGRLLLIHCEAPTPYVPRRQHLADNRRYAFCTRRDLADLHLAVKTLHDLGHRRVAMPVPPEGIDGRYEWARARLRRMRRVAARFFPAMCIKEFVQHDDFWYRETWVTEEDAFEAYIRDGAANRLRDAGRRPPHSRDLIRQGLRAVSPSLAAIVDRPDITALIAPNNTLARLYRCWFVAMGVPIPRRLSLLGFDNTGRSQCVPVSTIDQGFEELGFRAAHFLINDISVGERGDGGIYCTPVLRERGSLAGPG